MSRYLERGSSWWPVLWGPAFCAVGALLEWVTGPVHTVAWLIGAVLLAGCTALWVLSRRQMLRVELTDEQLRVGRQALALTDIAAVPDDAAEPTAPVLGEMSTVPRKFVEVPLRLRDGTIVRAWAKDGDALRNELRAVVRGAPDMTD